MTVINWMPAYQPLVTTGAGDFPIGYLPIGALPIGIFPIGALPTTGGGGGGWGCGRSAATAALSIPSDVAVTMRNFIRIPPTSDGKSAEPTTTVSRFYFRNIASTRAPSRIERPGSRFLPGVAEEPLLTKFGRSGLDRSVPCSLFGIFRTARWLNAFPR